MRSMLAVAGKFRFTGKSLRSRTSSVLEHVHVPAKIKIDFRDPGLVIDRTVSQARHAVHGFFNRPA